MAKTRFRRKSHGKKNKTARRQKRQSRRMRGGMPKRSCDPKLFEKLTTDGQLENMLDDHPSCNKLWTRDNHGNEVDLNNTIGNIDTIRGFINTQKLVNEKNWATANTVVHRLSPSSKEFQLTQCC